MTRKNRTRAFLATLALAGAFATLMPAEARACGGGWWPESNVDYRVMGVAKAEESLNKGDYQAAAGAVVRMIPHIGRYSDVTGDEIINRAMRVLAVAMSRTGGQIDKQQLPAYMRRLELSGHWNGKKAEETNDNLAWSAGALKAIAEAHQKAGKGADPVLESEMGEAFARVPLSHPEGKTYRAEGKAILERLADKDLLTSPEAYRALADLRADSGDRAGRLAALERCKAMASDAKTCGATTSLALQDHS